MTCKASIKRLSKENTPVSPTTSVKRWQQLSNLCYRFRQVIVPLAIRFSLYQLWRPYLKSSSQKKEIRSRRKLTVTSYWKPFVLVEIYFRLQNAYQRTNIEESLMNCYVTILLTPMLDEWVEPWQTNLAQTCLRSNRWLTLLIKNQWTAQVSKLNLSSIWYSSCWHR